VTAAPASIPPTEDERKQALSTGMMLALVSDEAPTRAILCAGAGNFATAYVTLTPGYHAGAGDDAGEEVIAHWREVSDRTGEIVPAYGFIQAQREVASAGLTVPVVAAQR